MVTPSVGSVVLVRLPFSDLSSYKRRQQWSLRKRITTIGYWVLCQITSNPFSDIRAIQLTDNSFAEGSLRVTSFARPSKLFTPNRSLMVQKVGALKASIEAVVNLLHKEPSA